MPRPSAHPEPSGRKDRSSTATSATSNDSLTVPPDSSIAPTSRLPRDKRRLDTEQHTRTLRPRPLISSQHSLAPGPVVYSIGKGFRSDEASDLEERVASLHRNPEVRDLCRSISAAAEHFLSLAHTASTGWGCVAKLEIPGENQCLLLLRGHSEEASRIGV